MKLAVDNRDTAVVKVTAADAEEAVHKANDPSAWEHEQLDELIDWEVVGGAKES